MWKLVVLGSLQGIFEWLPVSSEGIVAVFGDFFQIGLNSVDLAIFLHLGTLFAVIIFFWRDWLKIFKERKGNLVNFLIPATIVSLILGFFVYNLIQNVTTGNVLLFITGIGLLFSAYFQKSKKSLNVSYQKLGLIAGIFQGLAAIPGFSRSGSTIFGISLKEKNPKTILRLSYLMSAPAILASSSYLALKNPSFNFSLWPALLFSFIFGVLSLNVIIKVAEKINFFKFALIFAFLCILGGFLTIL